VCGQYNSLLDLIVAVLVTIANDFYLDLCLNKNFIKTISYTTLLCVNIMESLKLSCTFIAGKSGVYLINSTHV